jgi:hypothetical protein
LYPQSQKSLLQYEIHQHHHRLRLYQKNHHPRRHLRPSIELELRQQVLSMCQKKRK